MFEVKYVKDGINVQHVNINPSELLILLKDLKEAKIKILSVEDENHYTYNCESLIKNLKL